MSIIQEALKKAQCDNPDIHVPPSPTQKRPDEPIRSPQNENLSQRSVRTSRRADRPIVVLLSVILFFVAVAALVLFAPHTKDNIGKSKDMNKKERGENPISHQEVIYRPITATQQTSGVPLREAAVLSKTKEYPTFVLNGIMYIAGKARAIINDSVIEEGDTVSGARVVTIGANTVLLNFNDTEISLTLKK